jgi:hypothetical protein
VSHLVVRTGPDRVLDKFRPAGPDGGPACGPDWTGYVLDKFKPAGPDCEPPCGPDWTELCLRQI